VFWPSEAGKCSKSLRQTQLRYPPLNSDLLRTMILDRLRIDTPKHVCFFSAVLTSVSMIFMPESPVFLLNKGKEAEARKSLQWLRGAHYDISTELEEVQCKAPLKPVHNISNVFLNTVARLDKI
jgi:hypothetical protein